MVRPVLSLLLVVALLIVVAAASLAGEPAVLDDLAWMAGHWTGSSSDVVMEELWTAPAGGVMLGIHRDVSQGRDAFFEYLRIEARTSGLVYVASPRGVGTTEFALVRAGDAEVVFENPDHDFPRRIIYRRDGNLLIARIEGDIDGHTRSEQWEWGLRQ
jgi:hypothetical protein